MSFYETTQCALALYKAQVKKDILAACIQANDEAGDLWNISAIRTEVYKLLYN